MFWWSKIVGVLEMPETRRRLGVLQVGARERTGGVLGVRTRVANSGINHIPRRNAYSSSKRGAYDMIRYSNTTTRPYEIPKRPVRHASAAHNGIISRSGWKFPSPLLDTRQALFRRDNDLPFGFASTHDSSPRDTKILTSGTCDLSVIGLALGESASAGRGCPCWRLALALGTRSWRLARN